MIGAPPDRLRRVQLAHLIEAQSLTIEVGRELAGPALLDRVARINRQRFVPVLAQVLDGALTYVGVQAFGHRIEANPLLAITGGGGINLYNSLGGPWTADYVLMRDR